MAKKLIVKSDSCIGCGVCVALAEGVFQFDKNGKSIVKDNANIEGNMDNIKEAMSACPVNCIEMSESEETSTKNKVGDDNTNGYRQRTLIILKPDSVTRGICGEIISRFEKKGLKLVACKMSVLSEKILKEHYSHLADRPFFPRILAYMTSAPVILQVWEGNDAADVVRLMVGVTNPSQAQPGTIRSDFALSMGKNVIHASENSEIAKQEIERFFDKSELYLYKRIDEDMIYE